MSIPTNLNSSAILQAIIATLTTAQGGSNSLSFVNNIFAGVYPNIDDVSMSSLPAIVLEPDEVAEEFFTTGVQPAIIQKMSVWISCVMEETIPNKGLIGDPTQSPAVIGLMDFVDNVKNVLQADMTLGGTANLQKIYFTKAQYFFKLYPVRECKILATFQSQIRTNTH